MRQVSLKGVSEGRMYLETGKYTAEYSEMIGSTPGIWALISASISSEATGLDSLSCMYRFIVARLPQVDKR